MLNINGHMKKVLMAFSMMLIMVNKVFSNNLVASNSQIANKTFVFKLTDFLGTNIHLSMVKVVIAIIILFCIIFTFRRLFPKDGNGKVKSISKSTVKSILPKSDLLMLEYPYEGIVEIYKEDKSFDKKKNNNKENNQ